jgi:hypothetical protein
MKQPAAGSLRFGHYARAIRHGSGVGRALCFAGLLTAIGCLLVAIGAAIGGEPMVVAALVATCCCLLPGTASILISDAVDRAAGPLAALGVGMLLRTAVPLGLGLVLHLGFPSLAQASFMYFLLAAYLPALAFETLLTLPVAPEPSGIAGVGIARDRATHTSPLNPPERL